MKPILYLLLFFSIACGGQTMLRLRDVSFKIPSHFTYIDKQNLKMDYDLFHENGKISIDSTNTTFFPKMVYQYYENPGSTEDSKVVLQRLNDIMTRDFKPDTLIIDGKNDVSLAKYHIMGNTLFEIKSLGDNGWINIAYTDEPQNDKKNFGIVKEIAYSIRHKNPYNLEYKQRMQSSANATKLVIVALLFFVFITAIRKLRKKTGSP